MEDSEKGDLGEVSEGEEENVDEDGEKDNWKKPGAEEWVEGSMSKEVINAHKGIQAGRGVHDGVVRGNGVYV